MSHPVLMTVEVLGSSGAAQVPQGHDMSHPVLMTGTLGSSGLAGTTQVMPLDNLPKELL